jgi:hypothetical protein
MRLTFFALATGIVAGWAGGGRIGALGRVPLRAWLLLVGAIPLYIVTARSENLSHGYVLFVASLALVLLFVLCNVPRLPALLIVGIGLALNIATIAVNRGMPYSIDALHHSGIEERQPDRAFRATVQSHPKRADDRLVVLSDRISLLPLRELLSIGDIVMACGMGLCAYTAMLHDDEVGRGTHGKRRTRGGRAQTATPVGHGPNTAFTPQLIDLTTQDDELVSHDPGLAADPVLRASANEGLTLIRLLARTPELNITDDLFRTRERVRILGATPIETPELDDLAQELAATPPRVTVRVRPTGSPQPLSRTGEARADLRRTDFGQIDLFGAESAGANTPAPIPVTDGPADAAH